MKNKLFLFFGIISLFLSGNSLQAQQLRASYPVQVNAVLLPPYTLYLSDFCNSPREKIILTLLNRDLMEGDIRVRLHVSIHAGNIQMDTKDFNVLPVFTLQSGVPTKIDQSDLAPYFQVNNLNITGAFTGKFPEGMVEFCFSVFEANSGQLISQTSCARAWVTLNRPPLLSLPQDKANYPFREPQQIVFQWTPRHQALSNVEYEFTLKEIYDPSIGIENAFAYSPTIYSTTVYGTSLPYNTAINPPFLENRTYAWQVRAVVRDGFDELNVFENNGFSEIRSFSLMPACKPPIAPSARQEGAYERIDWTPSDAARPQVVAYRGKENQGDWHVQKANLNYANILDAAPGKEIEYKVGTVCVDGTIVYSDVQTFILEDWREKLMAQCGSGNKSSITNRTPIPTLNVGDVFTSAGVPVTITQITGSKGVFSGYGWMTISILGEVKLACKFTNVQVNSDMQHFGGTVESVYDKKESQMSSLNYQDNSNYGKGGGVEFDVQVDMVIPPNSNIVYDKDNGKLVVLDDKSQPIGSIDLPAEAKAGFESGGAYSYTVADKDGNVYEVIKDEEGYVRTENPVGGSSTDSTAKAENTEESDSTAQVENTAKSDSTVQVNNAEKEFKLTDLRAVDLSNTKRVAKTDETLYYINDKSTRNTKFDITISPNLPATEIKNNKIQWLYAGTNISENDGKMLLQKNIAKNNNVDVIVKAGVPNLEEKNVKIEWVNNYNKQVEVVSPGVKNALNELSKYVNNIGSVLKKLDNTGKLEFNISFQGQEYVEEDASSRFYNIVREGGFGGSIDLVFKGFTYGVDLKVATAQLYLKPILSFSGNGSMQYVKRNDQKEFTKLGTTMTLGLYAKLEAGGDIGFDVGIITIKANPYAGISSWGEIQYIRASNNIDGSFGIGKPYVGIKGEALLAGYNIIPTGDFKYTWDDITIELPFQYNIDK